MFAPAAACTAEPADVLIMCKGCQPPALGPPGRVTSPGGALSRSRSCNRMCSTLLGTSSPCTRSVLTGWWAQIRVACMAGQLGTMQSI